MTSWLLLRFYFQLVLKHVLRIIIVTSYLRVDFHLHRLELECHIFEGVLRCRHPQAPRHILLSKNNKNGQDDVREHWAYIVLYCMVLYCIVTHCLVLYCTAAVLHCTSKYWQLYCKCVLSYCITLIVLHYIDCIALWRNTHVRTYCIDTYHMLHFVYTYAKNCHFSSLLLQLISKKNPARGLSQEARGKAKVLLTSCSFPSH